MPGADPSTVTFVTRRKGTTAWTVVGSDDARPFRVFVQPVKGAPIELAAVVKDSSGQVSSSVPQSLRIAPFL